MIKDSVFKSIRKNLFVDNNAISSHDFSPSYFLVLYVKELLRPNDFAYEINKTNVF